MTTKKPPAWWGPDALLLTLCATAILLSFLLVPGPEYVSLGGWEVPVICPSKRLLGISCPGCGMTRSFTYLSHGHFAEAFFINWLGPLMYVFVLSQVPYRIIRLVRGWRARRASAAAV